MLQTIKDYKILTALCFVTFFVLMCFGPNLQSDSGGYLEASYTRGLFYPLFLKTCQFFWENLYGVVFIQLILGLGSIFYSIVCFSKLLERRFNIILQIGLFASLAMPYIGHTIVGNTILTEPLAYPLFLLFFSQLLLWRKFSEIKYFYTSLGLALCLMLTRKQLGFVFAGFYGWFFLDLLHRKKIRIHLYFLPLVFFVTGLFLEKSYMYMKTGNFISTPSAIFTISSPLFIAKDSDVALLKTPEQKHFLREAIKKRDKQKLGMHQEEYGNFAWPYHKKFEIIHDVLSYQISSKILGEFDLGLIKKEEFIREISLKILKNNLVSFYKFYYHNVINSMGGYYYFYAVLCAFFVCLWRLFRNEQNFLAHLGLMATGLQFLNYGTAGIFMPILRRYSIYADGLMICFWLLCLGLAFNDKKND